MAERQTGIGRYALRLILYYARAGCHQVFLIGYVGVYFELYVGISGVCVGRDFNLGVCVFYFRVDAVEATKALAPGP